MQPKRMSAAALVAALLLETMSRVRKTKANRASKKSNRRVTTSEYAGMTQEELLAELRKSKKTGADLLKENMKRKEKERTLADQLAQYGDIDPARARQLSKLNKPQKPHAVRQSRLNWNVAANSTL
jgi:hypothetical protein